MNSKKIDSKIFKVDGFLVGIISLTVFLLIGGVYLASRLNNESQVQVNPDAKVLVLEKTHDWGEIGLNDGVVEKLFEIKNEGDGLLTLSNVVTSCMCTTAQLTLDDEISPTFGMHTKSSYVLEVPEGETAQLKVVFDPAFHGPNGVGPINRQVEIKTNDANNPELSFSLTALVK